MSTPRSWAKIEFPVSLIDDEIRKYLGEEEGVRFNANGSLSDQVTSGAAEIEVEAGIYTLEDSDVPYGEFEELESILMQKGIPFDRHSGMDWNRRPELRVFRPANPALLGRSNLVDFDDSYLLDPDSDEPVVSVKVIRDLLALPMPTHEIQAYLEKHFPAYPPLADWVKEGD